MIPQVCVWAEEVPISSPAYAPRLDGGDVPSLFVSLCFTLGLGGHTGRKGWFVWKVKG